MLGAGDFVSKPYTSKVNEQNRTATTQMKWFCYLL